MNSSSVLVSTPKKSLGQFIPVPDFTVELKRILPESAWPWVFSALRQDPLIWDALMGDLGRQALTRTNPSPSDFTPGVLALLALDVPVQIEEFRAISSESINALLHGRAERAFSGSVAADSSQSGEQSVLTFVQAGLQAIHLHDRHLAVDSWQSLSVELAHVPSTVLACLYGMTSEPEEMVLAAFHGDGSSEVQASAQTLKAFFSQPIQPKIQVEFLKRIYGQLPDRNQRPFLRILKSLRPVLAIEITRMVAFSKEGNGKNGRLANDPAAFSHQQPTALDPREAVYRQLEQAEIYHCADSPDQEVVVLGEALREARLLEAWLISKRATAAENNQDFQAALEDWKKAVELDPNATPYLARLGYNLIVTGRSAEALSRLDTCPESSKDPALWFVRARLAAGQGDIENARQYARQAVDGIYLSAGWDTWPGVELARLLLQLNLSGQAVQVIKELIVLHPEQPELLALLSEANGQSGLVAEAVAMAHLAVSLAPQRNDYRRLLADHLEAFGDWESALVERSILLNRPDSVIAEPDLSHDLRALANCAIRAGRPEQAVEACSQALELQPEDGLAYALLGQARSAEGDESAALENLQQAIQLTPGQAAPWLALAEQYKVTGQIQKMIETLQTGTRATPDSPEVLLALGEAYLEQKSLTQALSVLSRAVDLVDSSPYTYGRAATLIAFRLGQTLHQLGHLPEARQILENAFRRTPTLPDLAYEYAQVLIALGEQRLALTPIETVLETHPDSPHPYLDYARCLLGISSTTRLPVEINSRPSLLSSQQELSRKAIPALRRVLEVIPEHAEAKALLAEALAANGEYFPAIEAYRQSMETDLAQEPGWQTRISLGLGQVALKVGQVETAIAALQESNAIDPLNSQIQRTLSEAYDAAGLTENAFQAARAAVALAPEDIDVLVWFADQALELRTRPGITPSQAQTEAINALNQATSLAPERTDLLIRLGEVQIQAGEGQAACNTFNKLTVLQSQSPIPERNTADLYTAAKNLLQLGDSTGAVTSLELALQSNRRRTDWTVGRAPGSTPSLLDLLTELAAAHYQAGRPQLALEALEQAIATAPEEASFYLDKADLHLEMSQTDSKEPEKETQNSGDSQTGEEPKGLEIDHIQNALSCLETALRLKPNDPTLYQRAALIQRVAGDLPAALALATQAITSPGVTPQKVGDEATDTEIIVGRSGRTLAGELARALFRPGLARKFVEVEWPASGSEDANERIDYYCLRAELALEAGELVQATDDLAAILEHASEHPRTLAIQARLLARRGDLEVAQQMLRDAIKALSPLKKPEWSPGISQAGIENRRIGNHSGKNTDRIRGIGLLHIRERMLNNQLAVAETAVDLHHWNSGLQLFEAITKAAPHEPLFQILLVRALVLRAEFQSLCQDLEVVRQAPGEASHSTEASELFAATIQAASENIHRWQETCDSFASGRELIRRWQARGEAIFQPSSEAAEKLNLPYQDPEDVTARVACLRKLGEIGAAGLAARAYPHNPRVLIQLALALSGEKPRQALAAAHAAVEAVLRPETTLRVETHPAAVIPIRMNLPSETPAARQEDLPLVYTLLAKLVHACGNRAGDREIAIEAIENALSIWPDEPRWHALAAQIYSVRSSPAESYNPEPVIRHLEQAITLEPKNPSHYLVLGKIFLREGASREAIIPLEQATRLAPDLPEPWLLLAKAFREHGDLESAAARAERAVTLAPEDLEPLLLRGEIALEANSPRGALSRAQAALHLSPSDPAAQLMLARSLSGLDRSDEALATLDKALTQARDPLPFQIERARLLLRSKSPDAALQALQELTDQYPSEPNVLSLLAECLAEAGQQEAAIQTAQRALRASHESPTGQSPLEHANIHYQLGRLLRRAGQLDGAIHHLSEAIQHAPGSIEPYLELGHTYQERREYTQALNAYNQATLIAPSDSRGFYHAGVALKESKDYLTAESMLRKAANLSPDDLSIHRLLAAVVALNLVHNRRESVRDASVHGTQISA